MLAELFVVEGAAAEPLCEAVVELRAAVPVGTTGTMLEAEPVCVVPAPLVVEVVVPAVPAGFCPAFWPLDSIDVVAMAAPSSVGVAGAGGVLASGAEAEAELFDSSVVGCASVVSGAGAVDSAGGGVGAVGAADSVLASPPVRVSATAAQAFSSCAWRSALLPRPAWFKQRKQDWICWFEARCGRQ